MLRYKLPLLLLLTSVIVLPPGTARAIEPADLENKVAFLRAGEVWIVTPDGRNAIQLTKTKGNIRDPVPFLFSPTLRYLAYANFLRHDDQLGAVDSIIIVDLRNRKRVKEIRPAKGERILLDRWLRDGRLLFHTGNESEALDSIAYDVPRNTQRKLDYDQDRHLLVGDFHPDGSIMVYLDYAGVGDDFTYRLHLVDLRTRQDRILVSTKNVASPTTRKSLGSYARSNDKNYVAFVETEYVKGEPSPALWTTDIRDGSLKELWRGKMAGGLDWSLDDRFIGMFIEARATLLEVQNPGKVHEISGRNFVWLLGNLVLYARSVKEKSGHVESLYLYDPATRKHTLFLKNTSYPQFLSRKMRP